MRRPSKNLKYILTVLTDDEVIETRMLRGLWREERKDGSIWIKLSARLNETDIDPNQMELAPLPGDHSPTLNAPEPGGAYIDDTTPQCDT